jgi:tRNA nucleotidyltransferase (CCA-adding enzyme)
MDLITTHVNADFDCLGAMVAVRRLYPGALLSFPGSQEKGVRDFLQRSAPLTLEFLRPRDVDLAAVTRLILVDCQHKARIGPFAQLVERGGVEVVVYDHHPPTPDTIAAGAGIIRPSGSTCTILTSLLMERSLALDPAEATMVMLGIYEDTGNLTFPSTTTEDYRAAAWLLEQGAQLSLVADHVSLQLTPPQVSLLNVLLGSLRIVPFHGVDVAIAEASLDSYLGDIAVLAHMIRDMENLDALFLVVAMGARVHLVARSRIPEVNVGAILRSFGGGGHAVAASATLRDLTVVEARNRLEEAIARFVSHRYVASEIMSSPVKTASADFTMAEAQEALVRYNLNAMPVVRDGEMVGIITRRILEKALYHGLAAVSVCDYMHSEFMRAHPQTPLSEIQDYFATRDRRLVPVFEDDILVGVVTRTDLLRFMAAGQSGRDEEAYDLARGSSRARIRNVISIMHRELPREVMELLMEAGRVAEGLGLSVYAVGGFVRDLLLCHPSLDIDLTVEGDGILFATELAERYQGRVRRHDVFGTAVVVLPDGRKVDVASTRLEYYDAPGALPTVERSSLKLDLYRRDFTINTLAIGLVPRELGQLHDFFGAYRDLDDRVLRVLHNLSFVEDPTRVFRAVRFEQRLGFRISAHTELLIRNAVKLDFPARIVGKRLYSELQQILREEEPRAAVERLAGLDLLKYIHPGIRWNDTLLFHFDQGKRVMDWYGLLFRTEPWEPWVLHFLNLCADLSAPEVHQVMDQLAFPGKLSQRIKDSLSRVREFLEPCRQGGTAAPSASRVHGVLAPVMIEVVLHAMCADTDERCRRLLSHYVASQRDERTILSGDDLVALGVPEGREVGRILAEILAARLDGRVVSRQEEEELARRLVAGALP